MGLGAKALWLLLGGLLGSVVTGVVLLSGGAANPDDPEREEVANEPSEEALLPDLRTLPPGDFRVQASPEEHTRQLRFSNTVWNAGRGPLEVRGVSDEKREKTLVTQILHSETGPVEEREVGEFVYHPDHDHFHIEDFALYELRSLTPGGEPGSVVASSGKVSFCITENTRVDGELISDAEQWEYQGCGDEVQGISPGWGDTYGSSVSGQKLNIEAVPDGEYALRSVADPENRLVESDADNNEAVVFLEIEEDDVRELEKPRERVP